MGIIGVVGNEWRLKRAGIGGDSKTSDGGEAERKRKRKEWDEFLNTRPGHTSNKSWVGSISLTNPFGHSKNISGAESVTSSRRELVGQRNPSFETNSSSSRSVISSIREEESIPTKAKKLDMKSLFSKLRPAPPSQNPSSLDGFDLSGQQNPPPRLSIPKYSPRAQVPSRPINQNSNDLDLLSPKLLSPSRSAPSPPIIQEMGQVNRNSVVVDGRQKINWNSGVYGAVKGARNPFQSPFDHPSETV